MLDCSSVQPVPALLIRKIPDSLKPNKSPLEEMWTRVHGSPEGSEGKSSIHELELRSKRCISPDVDTVSRQLDNVSSSRSRMRLSSSRFSSSNKSIIVGLDCASKTKM